MFPFTTCVDLTDWSYSASHAFQQASSYYPLLKTMARRWMYSPLLAGPPAGAVSPPHPNTDHTRIQKVPFLWVYHIKGTSTNIEISLPHYIIY